MAERQSKSERKIRAGINTDHSINCPEAADNSILEDATLPSTSDLNTTISFSTPSCRETSADSDSNSDLPDGAKYVEKGPARTPLFVTTVPDDVNLINQLRINTITKYIWRTPLKDTIVIGGFQRDSADLEPVPMMLVIDDERNITTHQLTVGISIVSGECIDTELSIVHVRWRTNGQRVFTARVHLNSHTATSITPIGKLEVINPCLVFRFSKNRFGVLCTEPCRIELFRLITLLTEKQILSAETILLDLPESSIRQCTPRACVTTDIHICVSLRSNHSIVVFNDVGGKLNTYDLRRGLFDLAKGGVFFCPTSVQCGNDGRLLICCQQGDVHQYDGRKWKLVKDKEKTTSLSFEHSVLTESRMWVISISTLSVYGTKNEAISPNTESLL